MEESKREIKIKITEEQTIIDLSNRLQVFHSEIYLTKVVGGMVREVNLKSLLGLITLQLKSGDTVTIKAVGKDHQEALTEVSRFFGHIE